MQTPAPVRCADRLLRAARAALLVIALSSLAIPGTAFSAMVTDGAWFIDGTGGRSKSSIAAGCFAAGSSGCGRRAIPLGGQPLIKRTRIRHSDSACSAVRLTILQGLQPAGLDQWNSGSLYNPDDGGTYRVSAELRSADVFVARTYLGVPLFGETKSLLRVPRLRSEGWC